LNLIFIQIYREVIFNLKYTYFLVIMPVINHCQQSILSVNSQSENILILLSQRAKLIETCKLCILKVFCIEYQSLLLMFIENSIKI